MDDDTEAGADFVGDIRDQILHSGVQSGEHFIEAFHLLQSLADNPRTDPDDSVAGFPVEATGTHPLCAQPGQSTSVGLTRSVFGNRSFLHPASSNSGLDRSD